MAATSALGEDLVGKTILHYEISAELGAGAMGRVFLARDTHTHRQVALKFLGADTVGASARERLRREAQAASRLSHPGIVAVHALEEADGELFLVEQYVEGETLARRVARGPLGSQETLRLARELTAALAHAHEHGVIHRDLKPANILVAADGSFKIADFGIARMEGVPTVTSSNTLLGTLPYMAPERARGARGDARADLFALGAILYEAMGGRRAFVGGSEAEVLYALMNEDPAPLEVRGAVLQRLVPLVSQLLAKEPQLRPAGAEVVAGILEGFQSTAGVRRSLRGRQWLVSAAVLIALAAAGLFTRAFLRLKPAALTHTQLTFVGNALDGAISPDGQTVAYVLRESARDYRLIVQDVSGGQPLEVFRSDWIEGPRWSPSGSEIVFTRRDSGLYIVPRLGGAPRRLPPGNHTAISPDGNHIALTRLSVNRIWFFGLTAGDTSSIRLDGSFNWVRDLDWSPSGKTLVFLTNAQDRYALWTIHRDGSHQQMVYEDSVELFCPRWAPTQPAIYCLRRSPGSTEIIKVHVAGDGSSSRRPPLTLLSGLQLEYFAVARDGHRLACTREVTHANLWLFRPAGADWASGPQGRRLTASTSPLWGARLSPDGKQVAYVDGSNGAQDIRLMSLEDESRVQLTFLKTSFFGPPVWSPDGREIAFGAGSAGSERVWTVPASGGPPRSFGRTLMSTNAFGTGTVAWSPGREILYQRPGNRNFHSIDPVTEAERPLLADDSMGWIFEPVYAPDGRHVAVRWNRVGSPGVWIVSTADSSKALLRKGRWFPIVWSYSGDMVYVWTPFNATIFRFSIATAESTRVVTLPFDEVQGVNMSSDGRLLVCTVPERQSDVWLVQNFDPEMK
jgi:Tol biopolymer transport system component